MLIMDGWPGQHARTGAAAAAAALQVSTLFLSPACCGLAAQKGEREIWNVGRCTEF